MYFSRSLLALFFVFCFMISLTHITAIFYKMASCAFLQFDVITSSNAAGCTKLHRVALALYSCAHFLGISPLRREEEEEEEEEFNDKFSRLNGVASIMSVQ